MSEQIVLPGDCLDVLASLPAECCDAIVTDPPYGLSADPDMHEVLRHWLAGEHYEHADRGGFMGRSWDSFVPGPDYWRATLRVLKPGALGFVFASARTQDLMTLALTLGGFEVIDSFAWLYGSGFPKSLNVRKAIGGEAGERWQGYGTALKPAYEPAIFVRRPCDTPAPALAWPPFLYEPKVSKIERDTGCESLPERTGGEATLRKDDSAGLSSPRAGAGRGGGVRNHHPTVKPVAVMRHLVARACAPGALVLDPFAGSCSTGVGAAIEDRSFVGIEREDGTVRPDGTTRDDYVTIGRLRIEAARAGRFPGQK